MAEHRFSLVCRSVRPNPETGNLDLIDVVDELHVAGVPREQVDAGGVGVELGMQIVSVWHRDAWDTPEDLEMRLVHLDPRGEPLGETDALLVDVRQYPVVRVLARFPVLPLRGYGVYRIRIEKRRDAATPWAHAGGDVTLGVWPAPQ